MTEETKNALLKMRKQLKQNAPQLYEVLASRNIHKIEKPVAVQMIDTVDSSLSAQSLTIYPKM